MNRTNALFVLLALAPAPLCAQDVSYRHDVMAVLSRAGCNQGTCHANLNGKGGFKLSLRGENPDLDYDTLTRGSTGRRVNRNDPDSSLILLKATGRAPHEGGIRFPYGSPEYQILHQWIAAGAPNEGEHGPKLVRLDVAPGQAFLPSPKRETDVTAVAVFADGSKRDVTGLAVYESTNLKVAVSRDGHVAAEEPGETTIIVRYLEQQATAQLAFLADRPDFRWAAPAALNYVDRLVDERLKPLRILPSEICSDSEFLRRAHLDLIGVLPTPDEARRFIANTDPDKRAKLVDALLNRPEYADWWALKWADLLRVEEKQLDKKGVQVFHGWIRKSFADNKPLNQFARELLVANGSTYTEPAANYYRALREPNLRSEAMAQVFLGLRMQCAKCHNHPYNHWTQNDYHQLAAFFARVQYKIIENNRRDKLDSHEFVGEQIVFQDDKSEVKHPGTGQPLTPRFLGKPGPELGPKDDRLIPLADWVADPANPFFARTQANRIWAAVMGVGLVDPIDDFRGTNPPSNEPLLDALTRDFVLHNFDVKRLIRVIATSRTYQLSSRPNSTNQEDETHASRGLVRPLPAEALLDAIAHVAEVPAAFPGYPAGTRAAQIPALPSLRRGESFQGPVRFLRAFGKPERLLSCDCERNDGATLNQALTLITGDVLNKALATSGNRIGRLLAADKDNVAIVDEFFLAALSRPPTTTERDSILPRLESADDRRAALEDVLWAIMNSKEFLLRR
jgi:hypothetical protein